MKYLKYWREIAIVILFASNIYGAYVIYNISVNLGKAIASFPPIVNSINQNSQAIQNIAQFLNQAAAASQNNTPPKK